MSDKKKDLEEELSKEFEEHSKIHKLTPEEIKFREEWKKRRKHVCKPCWELKYCPYGPLVENFPLLDFTRKEAIENNDSLKRELQMGVYEGELKEFYEEEVKNFNPKDYPLKHKQSELEKSCLIFGHMCPVFFVNELFTETPKMRRITRHIPQGMMLRIARRDNNTCQICGKHLLDNEIEFDHKIPFKKGGATEENNIQVTCFECNRKKGAKVQKDLIEDN